MGRPGIDRPALCARGCASRWVLPGEGAALANSSIRALGRSLRFVELPSATLMRRQAVLPGLEPVLAVEDVACSGGEVEVCVVAEGVGQDPPC